MVGDRLCRANGAAGAPAVLLALAHAARSPSGSIRRAEPSSHKNPEPFGLDDAWGDWWEIGSAGRMAPSPFAGRSPAPTKPSSRLHSPGKAQFHKTQLPPPLARQSPVPTKPRSGRQGVTDLLADLLHGVLLELADALGGDAVDVGQFVQGGLLLGQPAAPQDILGALVQRRHGQLQAAGGVIFPVALLELGGRVRGGVIEEVHRRLPAALLVLVGRG